jgi:hypothetical protein
MLSNLQSVFHLLPTVTLKPVVDVELPSTTSRMVVSSAVRDRELDVEV